MLGKIGAREQQQLAANARVRLWAAQETLELIDPISGTFSQTYGSILTVILHINDVPCCWDQA